MNSTPTIENNVYRTSVFDADYKRFAKKFVSLPDEIQQLEADLVKQPDIGTPLGGNIYKVRIACEAKGKGKSGGFRVITYLVDERVDGTDIYLITMYDKSEESSIKKAQLKKIIKKIFSS
jgi:hypothetical protein